MSASLVLPLAGALAGSPGAVDAFFHATALTHELLADPDARVSSEQFCAAWKELARLSGDPHIALRVASSIPPQAFGIVEYVCRSAPTLGAAVTDWIRYLALLNTSVKLELVEEGERVCLRVVWESVPTAPRSHELCFSLLVARVRSITAGPVPVLAVEFVHASDNPGVYESWFDAPVRFGAPWTQLVFPRAVLDLPLLTADPQLKAILGKIAEERAAVVDVKPPFVARVSRAIREDLRNGASIEQIAQKLGLTSRSLQRRLKEEGASFHETREEIRREQALRHLDDGLNFAEIAFLLGFSEPSAFFRAFKRWIGLTPAESRARRSAVGA